ncbi:hypothetical protein GQ55_7G011800 [Panicum hallii var. hallii]|uniref:Uncharacterized protein n=1 Tax=Panicum hallii var. hallii TaxID=1504633 RepID=A0A2T7CRN5_9POAL|nr:hypothetical protein GQ55_7G011800 [Panicum hallii var. hallii]
MGMEILQRMNSALGTIGLKTVQVKVRSVGHCLHAFGHAADQLGELKEAMRRQLESEGRAAAWQTTEYVLACLKSWDRTFCLDPIFQGLKEDTTEPALGEVQSAVERAVQNLVRDPVDGSKEGEGPGEDELSVDSSE